ncbi:rhomboid family intramembrane serine protease [Siphonobacter aquaeclarae]|uniref:Membrane associated serine protease, rhomboid family n=1 Tax=Siphonobacter aquaeclarae TaxID=563176 RepID=A0A1G9N8P0_9BACT|nr:rhomboid family intramembrane serine protease [Siphonobacter aquaeclarae]SDL82691.1 Membrane associated serine protease, rhomboid family [Siphonobacter aquaeclarae]
MDLSLTLLFVVLAVGASLYAWYYDPSIQQKWAMNPYQVSRRNEYWRFLTSGFIHADIGHLAFNMISLYSFGRMVESIFHQISANGAALFALLYIGGIIVSDLPTYFRHRNDPYYNSIGASGGVSSVIFSGIMFAPLTELYMFFIPIPIPGWIFGGLYIAYSYWEARRGAGYINHSAHLWGALYGIVFTIATYPPVISMFFEQIAGRF